MSRKPIQKQHLAGWVRCCFYMFANEKSDNPENGSSFGEESSETEFGWLIPQITESTGPKAMYS